MNFAGREGVFTCGKRKSGRDGYAFVESRTPDSGLVTPEFATLAEFAARLRVSIRTLEREIRDGRLSVVRVRSRRLIAAAEQARYIAAAGEEKVCQSEKSASDGKSVSVSEVADLALKRLYREAQPRPTRGNSKLRSGERKSTPRLAVVRNTSSTT